MLDPVLGKVLQPAPGGVPPGPAVTEHQRVDHVPQTVEESETSIDLSSVLGPQILKTVDETVEFVDVLKCSKIIGFSHINYRKILNLSKK